MVCADIFTPCEDLSEALQGNEFTCHGAVEAAAGLVRTLQIKRSDEHFEEMLQRCDQKSEELQLTTCMKRSSKTPLRYCHNDRESEPESSSMDNEWKRQYFQVVDVVTSEINRRFQQPGMSLAANREQVSMYLYLG